MEPRSVIFFSVLSYSWEPLSGLQLTTSSCVLHNSKGHRSFLVSGSGAPGIGQCGGPVSCHLHFHLWVYIYFFLAKGLLPVSELWLSPPKLSLQLQCTDGLRGCVCILGGGVYF